MQLDVGNEPYLSHNNTFFICWHNCQIKFFVRRGLPCPFYMDWVTYTLFSYINISAMVNVSATPRYISMWYVNRWTNTSPCITSIDNRVNTIGTSSTRRNNTWYGICYLFPFISILRPPTGVPNDILTTWHKPLFFLGYFNTKRICWKFNRVI